MIVEQFVMAYGMEHAAVIQCEQVLGTYRVEFDRIVK